MGACFSSPASTTKKIASYRLDVNISDFSTVHRNGQTIMRVALSSESAASIPDLWFRFSGIEFPLERVGDAITAAMVPSCMFDTEPCRVEHPLSAEASHNFAQAQNRLASWYAHLTPVTIDAPVVAANDDNRSRGVACCFSGGVDSWYSLLNHRQRVSHLLLVRGFDIGLANNALWRSVHAQTLRLAGQLGKRLIVCETNLRTVADRRRAIWGRQYDGDFWGECLHGAALAACALALGRTISELIVPATHQIDQLKPWGSSPMLDRYWSNDRVAITHDGCEVDRLAKVRAIAQDELALTSLRVCHNDTEHMNCGVCEKCVRTMLALRLCGALDRATTFPRDRAFAKLRRLDVAPNLLHHYKAMLEQARRNGDQAIVRDIEAILGLRFSAERTLAQTVRFVREWQRPA